MDVVPDGLIGVQVALARKAVAAMKPPILELAELLQFLHAGLDLARLQIAAAAGAAELQHRADDRGLVHLRLPRHAPRRIAPHPRLERPLLAVNGVAVQTEALDGQMAPEAQR